MRKRRKSCRPFSICLSTASRFSFILIFLPEMAERGAPESEEDEEVSLSLPLPLEDDEDEDES